MICGVVLNTKISMYAFSLGNYWMFVFSGIFGSIMWFGLAHLLRDSTLLKRWADASIFIVGTHYIGVIVVCKIALRLNISKTSVFDIAALCGTLGALLLYIPVCTWVNKNIPVLNGRSDSQRVSNNIKRCK